MSSLIKKLFFALLGVGALLVSHTYAADEGNNILNALEGENASWATSIVASGPTATTVNVEFPIFTSNGEQIMNYAISYVKDKSIASADLTDIKKMTFDGEKVKVTNGKVTLVLDGLTASSTYNFVVIPINKEGTELDLSDEVSFQTTAAGATPNNNNNGNGDSMINGANGDTMVGAADTASANFTYVVDNNKVTVKWTSIAGATKFAFSMKEAIDSNYTNVGEEMISKEAYSFVIGKKGLYTVKVVPLDAAGNAAGVERTLSIKIDNVTQAPGLGTPATGAGLNLILMSTFLMMLVYVVYRFRTTK